MATTNPLQFLQQVRGEVAKVVWPTRREVILTTIMVFIMAATEGKDCWLAASRLSAKKPCELMLTASVPRSWPA